MAINVGDRVRRHIEYGMEGGSMLPAEEGVVVYVHPEGRFYTVEFSFPGKEPWERWKIREAYIMREDER